MRILLVNKFIFPKGGAETYTFDVGKMLEEHGHEVQYFGLENEKNIVGNRVGSYVTNMDFSQGIKANLNAPFRIIYSREARKKIRAVLDDFQPDVVHLNNIQYHLTPSIILEINKWRKETKKECKIVYTTHKDTDVQGLSFPKNDVENPIWIYWSKGIEQAPIIVQKCYESVCEHSNQKIILLNDQNLADYIRLPDYIEKKKDTGQIPIARYADLMKFALLEHYGGT